MRIDRVVVNSSPLIVLFRSGQAELMPKLFSEVVVPEKYIMKSWRERKVMQQGRYSLKQTGL